MKKCANINCKNWVYNDKLSFCPSCYRKKLNGNLRYTGKGWQELKPDQKKRCANRNCSNWVDDDWWSLCPSCYRKSELKELVRTREGWKEVKPGQWVEPYHVYGKKQCLVTDNEKRFLSNISKAAKTYFQMDCNILPQVALSAFVTRSDNPKYQNELDVVVDFLITTPEYEPLLVIEINDRSHKTMHSKMERDNKLKAICKESRIPLIFLDGCNDALVPAADDLRRAIWGAVQSALDPDNDTYYLYQIKGIAEVPTAPPKIESLPSSVRNAKPQKKANVAKVFLSILFIAAMILGVIYLTRLFSKTGQNNPVSESTISTIEVISGNQVDASNFSSSCPMLLSLYDKSLTYSQESEQSSIEAGLEVSVQSSIKKMYYMKTIDQAWPYIYYGKNITVANAVAVISNYRIQYPHDTNLAGETWLVWVYPNFTFDDSGNLDYEAEHEYLQFLASDSMDDVQDWLFEEYKRMEITELDFPE